jgi:hypothetical protein
MCLTGMKYGDSTRFNHEQTFSLKPKGNPFGLLAKTTYFSKPQNYCVQYHNV